MSVNERVVNKPVYSRAGRGISARITSGRFVTNLLTESQSGVVGGYPINGNMTFSTNLNVAGITTGITVGNNSVDRFAYKNNHTYVINTDYVFSCLVKMDDGAAPSFSAAVGSGDFNIIMAGTDAISTGQSFVGNGVWRCWAYYRTTGTPPALQNTGILKRTTHSARTFTATGYQLEYGRQGGEYVVTGGSPVTQEEGLL
jgi:hypothetical protein